MLCPDADVVMRCNCWLNGAQSCLRRSELDDVAISNGWTVLRLGTLIDSKDYTEQGFEYQMRRREFAIERATRRIEVCFEVWRCLWVG